jgi:hypothetical protein
MSVPAVKAKGDVTSAPFIGVTTVMACAMTVDATKANIERKNFFTVYLEQFDIRLLSFGRQGEERSPLP